jgi:copper chaperone CopZ
MKTWKILVATVLLCGLMAAKEVKKEIAVEGMTCDACAVTVKKSLTKIKGVKLADIDLKRGIATITYDDSQVTIDALKQAIDKTGFKSGN